MKKILIVLMLTFVLAGTAQASPDGRIEGNTGHRILHVLGRGFLNGATVLSEFYYTPKREVPKYPRLWPVTAVPRTIGNVLIRVASGCYDVFINPFVAPFTDDLSPLTEPMGLPDYPWGEEG